MITLHRLGHHAEVFYVNHDMIVSVEANPDTVIRLMSGDRILVAETSAEVAEKVRDCRVEILALALRLRGEEEAAEEMALRFVTGPSLTPVEDPPQSIGQEP
ncbi:MAG TPA: flagellar FlbD family protein [Solirubrobacteraceae bacterium]|nr:flagellar FlbD family protein [Solirubrobacteraceae bacterium]